MRRGDRAETVWILKLRRPVCVQADPKDGQNAAESGVRAVQLVLQDDRAIRPLLGRKVRITGTLFHSITGHHHTPVLLEASRVEPAR